jgi:hypothetical protein
MSQFSPGSPGVRLPERSSPLSFRASFAGFAVPPLWTKPGSRSATASRSPAAMLPRGTSEETHQAVAESSFRAPQAAHVVASATPHSAQKRRSARLS